MKEFVLRKNLWLLDLIAAVVLGAFVSCILQFAADSGEMRGETVIPATVVGGASYAVAYIVAMLVRNRLKPLPSWVWIGVGGSFVLAAASIVSYCLVDRSIPFATHVVAISLLIIPLLLTIRSLAYLAYLLRTSYDSSR